MRDWSLYLVRTADGALYTGIAADVDRRFAEHGRGTGAKYLRGRGPLGLVFRRKVGDRTVALRAEHRLKRICQNRCTAMPPGSKLAGT